MDLKSILGLKKVKNIEIINETTSYDKVGHLERPLKITEDNAFALAVNVSEIYFPIDFLADRASKLRYYIADASGAEVTNTEFTRFIDKPNPFNSINSIIYDWVFSYSGFGNGLLYRTVPSVLKNGSVDISKITRIDALNPLYLELNEYSNVSRLTANKLSDLIKSAKYAESTSKNLILSVDNLIINPIDSVYRECSNVLAKSPLFKAERAINNLLATYSARYNVYVNNGAAGYLVKKTSSIDSGAGAIINKYDREAILRDVNSRNGLTGSKHLYGISSIPLEFINTLVHIKDLMPFEETENDAIQIAGVYQINPNLIPRREQAKYENQAEAESSVWENTLTSLIEEFCKTYGTAIGLDRFNYKVKADYSNVGALRVNAKTNEEVNKLKIENLTAMAIANPSLKSEIDAEIKKILENYGN